MRLLLISLDAAYHDDAQMLLSLPNLGRLADKGVFCDRMQTIYPSLTYPVHTSLLTGCYPDKHGIDHNERFMPKLPAQKRPWYWDAAESHRRPLPCPRRAPAPTSRSSCPAHRASRRCR